MKTKRIITTGEKVLANLTMSAFGFVMFGLALWADPRADLLDAVRISGSVAIFCSIAGFLFGGEEFNITTNWGKGGKNVKNAIGVVVGIALMGAMCVGCVTLITL